MSGTHQSARSRPRWPAKSKKRGSGELRLRALSLGTLIRTPLMEVQHVELPEDDNLRRLSPAIAEQLAMLGGRLKDIRPPLTCCFTFCCCQKRSPGSSGPVGVSKKHRRTAQPGAGSNVCFSRLLPAPQRWTDRKLDVWTEAC